MLVRQCFWLMFLLALLASSAASAEGIAWQTDVEAAWKQACDEERTLLIFISSNGCRYCTMMQNISFADPGVSNLVQHGYVAAAVNAQDVDWLIREQEITSYPTTLVILPSSDIVDRIKGYIKPAELKPRLAKHAAPKRTASRPAADKK